jgi:hypothetical protein
MTLHGNCEYDLGAFRRWYHEERGDLYFECVQCGRRFEVEELEKMFGVNAAGKT